MCIDWVLYILFMLFKLLLKVNVDNVIVMWIVYWERVNLKWKLMIYFAIDWIMYWFDEFCDYGIWWIEDWNIELCWGLRNELIYCDCGLKFVDMDWNNEFYKLFVLWMVMS